MTARFQQIVLIGSTLGYCWLGMQIVHEMGHVLAAYASGETVHALVLNPMVISRTDVSHDRHPLAVIWSGPILGALIPLASLAFARLLRCRLFYLFQFFAGFCLIVNGAYVGVGSLGRVGDAGDLLGHGAPRWTLILFGLVCAPLGLWLWNGLGPHFGLGKAKGAVDGRAVLWALGLVLIIVGVEILIGHR